MNARFAWEPREIRELGFQPRVWAERENAHAFGARSRAVVEEISMAGISWAAGAVHVKFYAKEAHYPHVSRLFRATAALFAPEKDRFRKVRRLQMRGNERIKYE